MQALSFLLDTSTGVGPEPETPETEKPKDEAKEVDDGAALPEDGLTAEHITMVMQHANCSRNTAVKALRDANDDMVAAVMKLTK